MHPVTPRPLRSAALLTCLIVLSLGCSSVERTTETHTTHFIDSGEGIANGAKIIDERPTLIAVFKGGAAVGTEERRLNGMVLFTPTKARQLQIYEHALNAVLTHPDSGVRAAANAAVAAAAASRPAQ